MCVCVGGGGGGGGKCEHYGMKTVQILEILYRFLFSEDILLFFVIFLGTQIEDEFSDGHSLTLFTCHFIIKFANT